MKRASYMDRQSAEYLRMEAAHQSHVRRFYMDEARYAKVDGDMNGLEFNLGMAEDASWRVRYAKRLLREMQQVAA